MDMAIRRGCRPHPPRLAASFDDVVAGCEVLASQVRGAGLVPAVVLAVPNGGLVPARLVAELLAEPGTCVAGTRQGRRRLPVTTALPGEVRGTVLVVDDICDSGDTLRQLDGELRAAGVSFATATVHLRDSATYTPDFSAVLVEGDAWVVYPWEREGMTV